jgi:hypothetical protein
VLSKLGEFFAQHYSSLLPMQAATTFVYADGADSSRRCVESAESFFRGAFGAAPVRIQSNATFASLLFNQGGLSSPNCPLPTQPELEGQIGGKSVGRTAWARLERGSRRGLMAEDMWWGAGSAAKISAWASPWVQKMNDAIGCCSPALNVSSLAQLPSSFSGNFWGYFHGPVFSTASLSEYLMLMYLNNMSWTTVAPTLTGKQRPNPLHIWP